MAQLLLINTQTIVIIVAVAAGAIALISVILGAVRKFSRLTWTGWQIPLVFAITPIFKLFPTTLNPVLGFILRMAGLAVAAALVLLVGSLVRHTVANRLSKPSKGWIAVDRVLGMLTAPLTLVVFFVVLGGLVLSALEAFAPSLLGVVYEHPVWANFFGQYAVDIFMSAVFLLVMRAGYRLGLLRALIAAFMFALTAVSAFGAILLTLRVGFMSQFALLVGGIFKNLHFAVAGAIGYGIVIVLVFAIFFTISMILSRLLDKLIRRISSVHAVDIVSGIIISVVFSAAFFAVVIAFDVGVAYLADGKLAAQLPESMQQVATAIEGVAHSLAAWITSSPLSKALYELNPFLGLIA